MKVASYRPASSGGGTNLADTAAGLVWPWTKSLAAASVASAVKIEVRTTPAYEIAKRILDLIASFVLLVLFAPLLAIVGVIVRLDSPGPAFFIQERAGRKGKLFHIYKFRSMYIHAPRYARSPTKPCDPRITKIGRLLRETSLDELPQLINVVLGDMSLVGPRPEMPFIVASYDCWQLQRLQVLPGITGLWQLSSARGLPILDNLHYDVWYIRNRSFSLDVGILIKTFFVLGRGV